MRPFHRNLLAILAPLLALVSVPAPAADSRRETVGLVLAGGGARGIAHAGVIKALEEMRIPVDAVAGTSMGALVGGLYAAGMNADDLREVIATMDWDEAFEDAVERDNLPQRRKSDDYDYASKVKLAFKEGTVSIPLGIVQGQQTRQLIKGLMLNASDIRDFDQLPIPYRAVATDIESGEAYVFSEGDVVTAMRASMSLPALLAPVEHDGKLLVDGGLAMNIPVEVGQQMGVDRLIVVDIGTPLRSRDDINNLLAITDQMLGFLTRRNSINSLAKMADGDILVNPDLTGMGMLDFDQADLIYERGYAATLAMQEQLAGLVVSEAAWSTYLAARVPPPVDTPTIDFVDIDNNSPVSDALIRTRITQPLGEPLDRDRLLTDIAAVYALDYWELIDYDLVERDSERGLLVKARAKAWGEDKLKMGLGLLTDLDGSSDVNLGASYLLKGVNELGGEFYGRAQLGDTIILSGEFYQPVDLLSRFFVSPYLGYHDYDVLTLGPELEIGEVIGSWRVRRARIELSGGANLFRNSQFRMGLFGAYGEYRSDFSINNELEEDEFQEGGVFASYRYDRLDDPFFPTRGGLLFAEYELHRTGLGADSNFERWRATGQAALSFGAEKRNTLILTGRTGQSIGASNAPQNYYQLGGLFNLSGLSQNLLSGRQMAFAMVQYQRRLSDDSVIPIDMPVYVGASLEGGQLWSERSDITSGDFINAGSVYLAINSPIGPVYVAYGRTEDSNDGLYLSLGWPFLSNQQRMGR
jgi:NTE family protein